MREREAGCGRVGKCRQNQKWETHFLHLEKSFDEQQEAIHKIGKRLESMEKANIARFNKLEMIIAQLLKDKLVEGVQKNEISAISASLTPFVKETVEVRPITPVGLFRGILMKPLENEDDLKIKVKMKDKCNKLEDEDSRTKERQTGISIKRMRELDEKLFLNSCKHRVFAVKLLDEMPEKIEVSWSAMLVTKQTWEMEILELKGKLQGMKSGPDFDSKLGNKKLIGVRSFSKGFQMASGGGSALNYCELIAIKLFSAMEKGVFVSCSAGNSGPTRISIANIALWIMIVGAGTLDRDFSAVANLGNGKRFTGGSLYSGEGMGTKQLGLVFNDGNISLSNLCLPGSLDPSMGYGNIMIGDRGVNARAENKRCGFPNQREYVSSRDVDDDNSSSCDVSFFVEDTSTSGTFLNWEKLRKKSHEVKVQHGDIISIALSCMNRKRSAEDITCKIKRPKGIGIGGPNGSLLSSFVRGQMLSGGFRIHPCDGGGIGSGLGFLWLERLFVDYGKKSKIGVTIYPSPQVYSAIVEPTSLPSKGRMAEDTLDLLKDCQLSIKQVDPRQYVAQIPQLLNTEFWFQQPKDIVKKLLSGDLDLGTVGLDKVSKFGQEKEDLILVHEALNFGDCYLSIVIPNYGIIKNINSLNELAQTSQWTEEQPLRVATRFTYLRPKFMKENEIKHVTFLTADGVIEASPAMGIADVMLYLLSFGKTLKENNLKEIERGVVLESQTVLVASRRALTEKKRTLETVQEILKRLEVNISEKVVGTIGGDLVKRLRMAEIKGIDVDNQLLGSITENLTLLLTDKEAKEMKKAFNEIKQMINLILSSHLENFVLLLNVYAFNKMVLVVWKCLLNCEDIWEPLQELIERCPNAHLENKVSSKRDSIDRVAVPRSRRKELKKSSG